MKAESKGTEFKYDERDVTLYNLGVGAKKTDLPLVLYVAPKPLDAISRGQANTIT